MDGLNYKQRGAREGVNATGWSQVQPAKPDRSKIMDNQFLTRIKRVNRLRAAVLDDRLSAREILEEAERVLFESLNKMQGWRRGR